MIYPITFLLSIILTPLFAKFALKVKIVDNPDGFLKPHEKITPYLGGLAVYFSFIWFIHSYVFIIFSTLITLLGFWDDYKGVKPIIRLMLEFTIVFSYLSFWKGLSIFEYTILGLTGVALINAANMLDGMDGVCAGSAAITLLTLGVITRDLNLLVIPIALLGFLIYNFYPAKIFLGDAGSYLIGFSIFHLITKMFVLYSWKGYWVALILSGLFTTDLIFGIIRRVKNKRSPFSGDRDHIYDKLKKLYNLPDNAVAVSMYIISIVFSFLGLMSYDGNFKFFKIGFILSLSVVIALGSILRLYRYD